MADSKVETLFKQWQTGAHEWSTFLELANSDAGVKTKVADIYKKGYSNETAKQDTLENAEQGTNIEADWVWKTKNEDGIAAVNQAATEYSTKQTSDANTQTNSGTQAGGAEVSGEADPTSPFDRRLDRLEFALNDKTDTIVKMYTPMASSFSELSTSNLLISKLAIRAAFNDNTTKAKDYLDKAQKDFDEMKNNEFYKGVPALQNYYSLIRLYGSNGGKNLVNKKGQRRWYEVDSTNNNDLNFASTPTTTALISWGSGDPYGRTPYQFTDFVFSKYWRKIENNRLITLRRYPAPILDNLKFPGMGGNDNAQDTGSSSEKDKAFTPMATAITYFGGDTGNSLNSILKFTTGFPWEDVQGSVWEVNTDSVPSNESGPGKLFKGVSKFAEMLNVAGGKFDRELVQAGGVLPPDPYVNGPYENRIMGPVNRIDSVKKRKAGINFQWDGISLVFEYVARPVGGINPKAVLLDIMGNFLVIGSASAVFFGGAHRFMANPAKYPFLGGGKGIEEWYKGNPVGWAITSVKQFTQGGDYANGGGSPQSAATGIFKNLKGFFDQLFSGEKGNLFGAAATIFSGSTGNIINNAIASKTAGQVPYLQGMKAILTGEPVGEWHVTVGNPLNPIAMIGNLVCENMTVEFNDELGPDDFPTEIKITVNLKHAMARDRDAIESVFNRGMGRIYNLPDSFSGSADFQTKVDNATLTPDTATGFAPNGRANIKYTPGADSRYLPPAEAKGSPNKLGGELSIWNRPSFSFGVSQNIDTTFVSPESLNRSAYKVKSWIAQRANG